MAKRNFNGSQINQSVTTAEQAGAALGISKEELAQLIQKL